MKKSEVIVVMRFGKLISLYYTVKNRFLKSLSIYYQIY